MDKVCRLYELGSKEVINLFDGVRVGHVRDVEIDMETGMVKNLIIPGGLKVFGLFGRDEDLCVPWECIQQMGEEIIFIKMAHNN